MSQPGLRVEAMDVSLGGVPVLRSISISVARGEVVAVVGSSGAGKTTLLRAISGLLPTGVGTVTIGGRDVTTEPPERRGAVYLHQTPVLFPHLTVGENVAFPLRLRRRTDAEVRSRVERLLRAVDLPDLAPRMPRTLSGGQRHRVALARALAAEPAVLLLDEPLSALDPSLRAEVRDALLTLQAEYAPAVVLVTHDLDEAALVGDRVAVLLGGSIVQVAPPAALFRHPCSLAVARFLGIGNEIAGRVTAGGIFECPLGRFPLPPPAPAEGGAVALVPPHALMIQAAHDGAGRVETVRHRVRGSSVVVRQNGVVLEAGTPGSSTLAPGEPVCIRIDPACLVVFARGDRPG